MAVFTLANVLAMITAGWGIKEISEAFADSPETKQAREDRKMQGVLSDFRTASQEFSRDDKGLGKNKAIMDYMLQTPPNVPEDLDGSDPNAIIAQILGQYTGTAVSPERIQEATRNKPTPPNDARLSAYGLGGTIY